MLFVISLIVVTSCCSAEEDYYGYNNGSSNESRYKSKNYWTVELYSETGVLLKTYQNVDACGLFVGSNYIRFECPRTKREVYTNLNYITIPQ